MEKDAKLYAVLQEKIARFITHDRLEEMAHTLDTNMNEAFNNICTWFAPKNKVFAGTGSLNTRIALAVGINSLGVEVFFKRLFKKLGLPLTPNVAYYLSLKEKNRNKRLQKVKTRESKLKKNKGKNALLAKNTLIAKIERRKREGTYRKGMNLDDPEEEELVAMDRPQKKKTNSSAAKYCEYCGVKGHVTQRSSKCKTKESTVKKYRQKDGSLLTEPPTAGSDDEVQLEAEDCEELDARPFDFEYESDTGSQFITPYCAGGADDYIRVTS
jgi:hypothetical protein